MQKIELLRFVAERIITTSPQVAAAFSIPLRAASAYLSKAHGRGYLVRQRVGSGFEYSLSRAGERKRAWAEQPRW